MTHKKIITLLLCFVLCFTFVSAPFQADAAAIAIPATVLGIVGLFVVSAGYTFDSVGDFRTAVSDFCNKNFNMSNGSGFMDILRVKAPDAAGLIELGSVISSEYFPKFWQAIKDFFGGGDVEVETGTPAPPAGMAYYNGELLPVIPSNYIDSYPYFYISKHPTIHGRYTLFLYNRLLYWTGSAFYAHESGAYTHRYYIEEGGTSWIYSKRETAGTMTYANGFNFIWSNVNVTDKNTGSIVLFGSEPVTSGEVITENIPVAVDSTYNPDLVYNGWMSKVQAEPWMTYDATSAVFQDITTAETDKTAPMTVTQTGVLSQGGVKVETETDVVIPEYTGEYAVNGLTSIFPFCIPFDVYDFFSVLVAEREAPKFDFNLNFGKLGQYPLSVDLTGWDTAATILRTIELLAFCVGLALATSKLIKW